MKVADFLVDKKGRNQYLNLYTHNATALYGHKRVQQVEAGAPLPYNAKLKMVQPTGGPESPVHVQ